MFTFAAMSAVMSATLACACRQKSSSEPSEPLHALHSALRVALHRNESPQRVSLQYDPGHPDHPLNVPIKVAPTEPPEMSLFGNRPIIDGDEDDEESDLDEEEGDIADGGE